MDTLIAVAPSFGRGSASRGCLRSSRGSECLGGRRSRGGGSRCSLGPSFSRAWAAVPVYLCRQLRKKQLIIVNSRNSVLTFLCLFVQVAAVGRLLSSSGCEECWLALLFSPRSSWPPRVADLGFAVSGSRFIRWSRVDVAGLAKQ